MGQAVARSGREQLLEAYQTSYQTRQVPTVANGCRRRSNFRPAPTADDFYSLATE